MRGDEPDAQVLLDAKGGQIRGFTPTVHLSHIDAGSDAVSPLEMAPPLRIKLKARSRESDLPGDLILSSLTSSNE